MPANEMDSVEILRTVENTAQMAWRFFHTLKEEGFKGEEALALTSVWLSSMITASVHAPPKEED